MLQGPDPVQPDRASGLATTGMLVAPARIVSSGTSTSNQAEFTCQTFNNTTAGFSAGG